MAVKDHFTFKSPFQSEPSKAQTERASYRLLICVNHTDVTFLPSCIFGQKYTVSEEK